MRERKAKPKPPPAIEQTEQEMRTILINGIVEATARTNAASQAFIEIIGHHTGPDLDGAKRIHNASSELSAARLEMMKAHKRLDDFVERVIEGKTSSSRGRGAGGTT
jgi:hypothetical protein